MTEAARIAYASDAAPHAAQALQFLIFTVGREEYGVDIVVVREIKGWTDTTRLPNTPDFIRGVLNLRGVIVPILDLRARLGGELTAADEKSVVVIVAVGARLLGILVDAVLDILSAARADIKPPPESAGSLSKTSVSGLIAAGDRMVVLLDIEALLARDMENVDAVQATEGDSAHG